MSQDLKLVSDNSGLYDLEIDTEKKSFQTISGFETSLILSVFSDRRSTKDDIPDPLNRKGWIGDILTKRNNFEIGSFLYLKDQSRDTQLDRNEIKAFIEGCLKHLVDIKALKKIIVEILGNTFNVFLYKDANVLEKYNGLWRNTNDI
jgi:phage gp46-like protein